MSCYGCGKKEKTLAQRMNKRISVAKQTENKDSYGERLDVWLPVATIWAAVEPLRGREYFSAKAEHAEVTTRIRIRYRNDIDRTMRVVCDGIEFEILHIINPEFRHEELQLMCKERQ